MAAYLPFVMQEMFNCPMAMHQSNADMIIAAVSGRLNITELVSQSNILDARALDDLASMGRLEARQTQAKRQQRTEGPAAAEPAGDTFLRAGNIAVVPVLGTLKQRWGVGPISGATGYDGIQTMLLDAAQDDTIKGIWCDIGSGGGAVDGLWGTVDVIRGIGEKFNGKGNGKPIYAMAADRAMSAAFAIGTAADKLFVPPTGSVGSVGVITMLADATKALDNEGIKVQVVRYPENKALSSGPEPIDEGHLAEVQANVKEVAEMFQDMVAQNMGISKKTVAETKGRGYMGKHAKVIGFANDVLSEAQAWAKLTRKVA